MDKLDYQEVRSGFLICSKRTKDIEDYRLKLYLQKFDDSLSFGRKWSQGKDVDLSNSVNNLADIRAIVDELLKEPMVFDEGRIVRK